MRSQTLNVTPAAPAQACLPAARNPARALARAERERLTGRAMAHGPGALDDVEALQLLCGLAETAASDLLAVFGSAPEVFGAAAADLARVAGRQAALRLKLAQDVAARALAQPLKTRDLLTAWSQVEAYLRTRMSGAPREQFRVLFLDKKNRLIADELMNEGTVDHAPVYPREVARRALELHASALVVAHNHPSGDANPSSADIEMTRQIVDAARPLRIVVHDHVLVAGERAVSFRSLGLL